MTPAETQLLEEQFTERYEDANCRIFASNDGDTIVAEIRLPYVPIEGMMTLLKQVTRLVEFYGGNKFILDQRKLMAFHQPTVEWIDVEWKKEMYHKFGLVTHRQLFSDELWFRKCLEAGQALIRKNYPTAIVHTMDVRTCQSLDEAVRT
jgi:hypothetical protein